MSGKTTTDVTQEGADLRFEQLPIGAPFYAAHNSQAEIKRIRRIAQKPWLNWIDRGEVLIKTSRKLAFSIALSENAKFEGDHRVVAIKDVTINRTYED